MTKPKTENTSFGAITIDGQTYRHDVLIRLDGEVTKRQKKLSKQVYGTSHTISEAEAQQVYEDGAEMLIIGAGQYGLVNLSQEASQYFQSKNMKVLLESTPRAIEVWNETGGRLIGLFHITC